MAECLQQFTQTELLDEPFKCSKCKTYNKASKQLQITKCPELLVLHLKRFSFNSWSRDKIESPVAIPLQKLSLKLFTSENADKETQECYYELYGISHHYGGLGGGHYVANIFHSDNQEWYLKDDSRVLGLGQSLTDSIQSSAYVLFYQRKT